MIWWSGCNQPRTGLCKKLPDGPAESGILRRFTLTCDTVHKIKHQFTAFILGDNEITLGLTI